MALYKSRIIIIIIIVRFLEQTEIGNFML